MSETVDIHGIPGIIMHWLPKNNCFYQKMMFVMISISHLKKLDTGTLYRIH
jgi:hypothetical protein